MSLKHTRLWVEVERFEMILRYAETSALLSRSLLCASDPLYSPAWNLAQYIQILKD